MINMMTVNVVTTFRLIAFRFVNDLVIRQCCQIWTSISAYHVALAIQWNEPHEAAYNRREERIEMKNPAISSISTIAFEIGFEKKLFMINYVLKRKTIMYSLALYRKTYRNDNFQD